MTATLSPSPHHDTLLARLASLRDQREATLAEITPDASGDMADRATNVDGHVRLAMLDERIAAVEIELTNPNPAPVRSADNTVAVGDIVTVDFGDGPEKLLLGSLDQAEDDVDVVTPGSPLGQALLGAAIGANVAYATRTNRKLHATVIAIG